MNLVLGVFKNEIVAVLKADVLPSLVNCLRTPNTLALQQDNYFMIVQSAILTQIS